MRLFLFNPENDIALASGLPHITPPRQAAALHRAGAMLPFWLGDGDDYILVDPKQLSAATGWLKGLGISGPRPVSAPIDKFVEIPEELIPTPWGWSADACHQFSKCGLQSKKQIPTDANLTSHRELSSRKMQLEYLQELQRIGETIPHPSPIATADLETVKRFIFNYDGAMLKSPWSSSGRGVSPVTMATFRQAVPRIEGIIRSQGYIMVEPMLTKLLDFALLFEIGSSSANYLGVSIFTTSTNTNYGGNLVGSETELRTKIESLVPARSLNQLIASTTVVLSQLYCGRYTGPVGVDMMVFKSGNGTPAIAPCIEINLRYTMGFVARGIYQKIGKRGIMSIMPDDKATVPSSSESTLLLVPDNQDFIFLFEST